MEILNLAMNAASNGLGANDAALSIARVGMGVFFAISGANKLFVPARHANIKAELVKDKIPCVKFMEWWVPGWEFVAGGMLLAGVFSAFAAAVLLIICMVAICCNAKASVDAYAPINKPDRIADYLYLPEVLYALILIVIILGGPGAFALM